MAGSCSTCCDGSSAAPPADARPASRHPQVRFLHVLSAMAWVGGQIVLSAFVLPVLRRGMEPEARQQILRTVGRRFRAYTIAGFLPVQVATGVALAAHARVTLHSLTEPGYGRTLGAKILLVGIVLGLSAGHGFCIAARHAVAARLLAIGTLAGSVGIVLLATALVR